MLTLSAAAQRLGATVPEIMDAGNITRDHAVFMAKQAGLTVDDYARVPMIPECDVALIGMNLERDRAEEASAH